MIGKTLGHYRILEKIGAGGMGEVYRAHDERLNRDVALKVLPAGTLSDEPSRKRFRNEALTLSQLNHPNIAVVFDFDTQEGVDFLAMELVAGVTLAEKLKGGALPENEVRALGTQMLEALEEAHERSVVHRDLKPGNIVVTPKGRVKVLDFGLAKLLRPVTHEEATAESFGQTQAGTAMGTVPYMSPEQLRGEAVDARTDLYAAGAVLYEMATGRRTFSETQAPRLIESILHQPPQPPREVNGRVSAGLESLILKALEKEPARRYQSAKELLTDLERLSEGQPVSAPRQPRVQKRRWAILAVGALAATLALLVGLNFGGLRERLLTLVGARHGVPLPKIESIAVLPLENLSGDKEQDYFADGMTEELITNLAKISALKVISRTSVMQFKGVKKPLPQIARELGVDGVIEGSVLREGDQMRISVQLIHAATDRHLWAESYQRDLRGVLALQSEVARAVASEVRVKVTPAERAHFERSRSVNPDAYEAYLRGRYYLDKRTEEGIKKALEYFQEAVHKDPTSALPYAGLADGYNFLAYFSILPPQQGRLEAKAAALKALEVDPSLAEAHTALARVMAEYDWDWRGAETEFQRAIRLNPSYAFADQYYGMYLSGMGRHLAAVAEGKRALELDPLSLPIRDSLGMRFYSARQYDNAIEQFRKVLEMDANYALAHLNLSLAYMQKGMYDEGRAEALQAIALSGVQAEALANLGYASGVLGKKNEAEKALRHLNRMASQRYVSPILLAEVYVGLRNKTQALAWLERAYQERALGTFAQLGDPAWDLLRSDLRFQDLLRRMGLPP